MVGTLTAGQCKSFFLCAIQQNANGIRLLVAIYGDIKRVLGATGGVEIAKVTTVS